METQILIVGGGLAGVSLAEHLSRTGVDFLLVEAQERLGGRILTEHIHGGAFDLGPAWYWPGQPRMAALVARLGLTRFSQYASGSLVFQDQTGAVHRDRGYASMQGSYRVAGGMGALIDGLSAGIAPERIRLNTKLVGLDKTENGVQARLRTGLATSTIRAQQVVLAIPPRVAAAQIDFSPALPSGAVAALEQIPTWMAGQAKILAVYDRPHWRMAGLSGDAMSQRGPMVEIHDASPEPGGPFALFGFVGVAASIREHHRTAILDLAREQLVALFGPQMGAPLHIALQDWAQNPFVATRQDRTGLQSHPAYGEPAALSGLWDGRLQMASTEMGAMFGGFLEGALEAAETAALRLSPHYA